MATRRVVKNPNSKANTKRAKAAEDEPPWNEPKVKKAPAKLKEKLAPIEFKGEPAKTKIPKKLSECVDLYEAARRRRLEIQKEAQDYAELEGRLREHLIDSIPKSDAAGVTGRTHRVTVKVKQIPQIVDEAAFMKAARRKGNEDLLVEKPNMAAIQERWEAEKTVPGVGAFNAVSLSLNKL
jgi:hypothetical protein